MVCRYDFHGSREHDFHIDLARISREGEVWTVRDQYLDVLLHDGLAAEIVDTEELLAAHRAGYIETPELYDVVERAHALVSDLARARYRLDDWLAGHGLRLDWLPSPEPAPA